MRYLLLLILTTSSPAFAQSNAGDKIVDKCITTAQLNVQCEFPKDSGGFEEGPVSSAMQAVLWTPMEMLSLAMEKLGRDSEHGKCATNNIGQVDLESVTSLLQHAKVSHKLSECQAACLATCATSAGIEYDFTTGLKTPCGTLIEAGGVCSDYTTLSIYFMTRMGVHAQPAYSAELAHNFVKVQIGKKDFFMDPQQGSCKFFDAGSK